LKHCAATEAVAEVEIIYLLRSWKSCWKSQV